MALRYYAKSPDEFVKTKFLNSETSLALQSETSFATDSEDFLLRHQLPFVPLNINNLTSTIENENTYDFTTDQEIISAIEEISRDEINYPEVYRRCCKVWLRIVNLPFSKNLIWDVDSNIYPDYYSIIKKPINFSQVAYNLLKKSYPSDTSTTSTSSSTSTSSFANSLVVGSFYRDMRQVLLNCFTYNTESIVIVSQA